MNRNNKLMALFVGIFSANAGGHFLFFTLLTLVCLGLVAFSRQFTHGLGVTGLHATVPWGLYIGHFLLAEALATAVLSLYVLSFLFSFPIPRRIYLWIHTLAVCTTIGAILFVFADLGRPERFLHLLPPFGILSFSSAMSFDVIVLNLYLFLNLLMVFRLVFGRQPKLLAFCICLNGLAIHFAAAFLFSGFTRPFWSHAFLPLQFIVGAFLLGLCLIYLVCFLFGFQTVEQELLPHKYVIRLLLLSLFILLALQLGEYYVVCQNESYELLSSRLMWSFDHAYGLWYQVAGVVLWLVFFFFCVQKQPKSITLAFGSLLVFMALLIKKGSLFVIAGFQPSPLGEMSNYLPTFHEYLVTGGVWSAVFLLFLVFYRCGNLLRKPSSALSS